MPGQPKQLFAYQAVDNLSTDSVAVGTEGFDGVWINLTVSGTSPSATLTVEGADQPNGEYRVLDVPNARHINIKSALSIACPVSANYVKLRLASISGTFGAGQGYTITVTPANLGRELATLRHQGALLHNATTATNKLSAPGALSLASASVTGGTLSGSTAYYVGVAALTLQSGSGAILGITTATTKAQTTSGGHNAIRIGAPNVSNVDAYLVFCSQDAAPKLAGYLLPAWLDGPFLVNGLVLTTVFGTPVNLPEIETKSFHVGVDSNGSGLQTNHAIFAQNTAHFLDSLTTLDCRGRGKVLLTVRAKLSKSSVWTAAPSLTLLPWFKSQEAGADWARGTAITPTYLAAAGDSLTTYHSVDVDGAGTFAVSVSSLAGLASVDVWAELAPSL